MPPPSSARGRRGRAAEPTTTTATAAKKRGRPAAPPPPSFDAAPAPESASTRRSARNGGGAEGTSGATTTATAAAAGGCFLAETPAAKKTRWASDVAGVPCTPRGAGATLGHVGGMAVAATPGTVRGPRRGEVLYSKNGSPIGAVEDSDDDDGAAGAPPPSSVKKVTMTASKARRPGRKGKTPADDDIGLVLTTDDGKEIDIAAVGADGGAEEVEATMGMLAKMQAQVAAHMARLMAAKR
jgi:hypothetical protein